MLAKTFGDITYPDDLDADLRQAAEVKAGTTSSYRMEKRLIKRDGTVMASNWERRG